MVAIWHYDGLVALRRSGTLEASDDGFSLSFDGTAIESFAWDVLVARDNRDGQPSYGHRDRPGWRIGFVTPPPPALADRLPRALRYGGLIDGLGLLPSVAALAVLSAAVLAALFTAPRWIAPLIPASLEVSLGNAMIGDFGGRFCQSPDGVAALDRLARALPARRAPVTVTVANLPLVNAVALPGGKVIVFQGLIEAAQSSDEVAGVLAHEIGHVEARHVMQALIRQFGLSVLASGMGGDVGGYASFIVGATYSRDAEREADGYAIAALRAARISPNGTADFFKRMARDEAQLGRAAKVVGYFSSHPLSDTRELTFRASRRADITYTPPLSEREWQSLRTICAETRGSGDSPNG